jgi:large subunit ribosomal protein L29
MKRTQTRHTLADKTPAQLQTELEALLKAQFGLRMQRATQQLANTAKIRDVRRGIARVKTLLAQTNRGQAGAGSQAKGKHA